MTDTQRILVVGAGPVGLVTAFRLASFGIPCTVLDENPELEEQLRASTFHPPTLDMLDEYGLGREIARLGRITPTWQIRMHDTGERAEFDLGILADHTAHPYRVQCEQKHLCRLLMERLVEMPNAELRFGRRVEAAGQDNGLAWADAVDKKGERTRHEGAYVIGCDGATSVVREAMGVSFSGHTYPETTLLVTTTVDFAEHVPGLSGVNYVWKRGGTYSLLHLPEVWRCSFEPRPGESDEEACSPESVQAHLNGVMPRAEPYPVRDVRPYRVHQRIAGSYRAGRLIIAGDAAHLNSPKGGMGMNGGIHDAFNLTEKLARIMLDGASEDLLDLYVRQRRPIAEQEIIAQADANRSRMNETDQARRLAMLRELQDTARDPERRRAHLLRSSMIAGLRRAAEIT